VLNAIATVIERYMRPKWIFTTAASIKGRGTHFLHTKLQKDLNKLRADGKEIWIYKNDIRHYYESIPHDKLKDVLAHYIKDKKLLLILGKMVDLLDNGISIGLRVSQTFGNMYLNYYLDHVMKDQYGFKFYRYCDDCVVVTTNHDDAVRAKAICHECAKRAGLEIKPNERIWRHEKGDIDFLGYRTYSDGMVKIRTHIKKRFIKRWNRVVSKKRKQELFASFYGICKYADCNHLFKKIFGMNMEMARKHKEKF
jgi:hypothetical protein